MGSFCASHDYQELKAMERATSDYVMGRASLEDIWELLESGDGESHIGTEKLRSALLGAFLFFSMVYNPKRKKVPSAKQAEPYVDKLFGYVARKVGGFRNYMIFMSAGAGRTCLLACKFDREKW
ncbi:hypothetical protein AAMO2058_001418400 [Amorphochlora amoebiformis]